MSAAATRASGRAIGAARSLRLRVARSDPRKIAAVAAAILILAALFLPPFSLVDRLVAPGHARLRPGADVSVPARGEDNAVLEVQGEDILRSARIRLAASGRLPFGAGALPSGQAPLSAVYRLDVRGPVPESARVSISLPIDTNDQPFVDGYAWDGERWRWVPRDFVADNRIRLRLPLAAFVPEAIVVTRARTGATELSASLMPPPARVPAAAAELPVLEIRAYQLADADGGVARRQFEPVSRRARIYGVVENREGDRVRGDLISNVLIRPETRRAHRAELLRIAREDDLDGIVLDYLEVPDDLQPALADLVGRLRRDLAPHDIDLVVTVPMPRWIGQRWDGGAVRWRELGDAAGVRVRLPDDRPLEIDVLDGMVRWALGAVDRRHLQLALPVWGRDIVDGQVKRIGFGEALELVLDMARSDAPRRISPGVEAEIDLPTMRAAELGRDPDTGMWRFHYWGANRRRHTVWLNDAAGLEAAFNVAAYYRLGRLTLDGVTAGVDPRVWRMARQFVEEGRVEAEVVRYALAWRMVDTDGNVVRSSLQDLTEATFRFEAPITEGEYRLEANLVTQSGQPAAVGQPLAVRVAQPPPPSPTPTVFALRRLPTPESVPTAPPPLDEAGPTRTPIRIGGGVPDAPTDEDWDGEVAFAEAALRTEPDVSSRDISDLKRGDRLIILESSDDGLWLRVRLLSTGVEGWVLAALIEERARDAPAETATLAPPVTRTQRSAGPAAATSASGSGGAAGARAGTGPNIARGDRDTARTATGLPDGRDDPSVRERASEPAAP